MSDIASGVAWYYGVNDLTIRTFNFIPCSEVVHVTCTTWYEFLRDMYRIAENFRGRKISRISRFCCNLWKFCPWNLGVWRPLAWQKQAIRKSFLYENRIFHWSAKVFSTKIVFFTDLRKFSPSKVFCYTVVKKAFINYMHLQGFSIDSHTFACVRHMISYRISSIRYSGYCSRVHLIERIQWYNGVVVPKSQLFLSLLLQCWN